MSYARLIADAKKPPKGATTLANMPSSTLCSCTGRIVNLFTYVSDAIHPGSSYVVGTNTGFGSHESDPSDCMEDSGQISQLS